MRRLINYIRSCFCKHDWELLKEIQTYESAYSKLPHKTRRTYRCKKCGYVQRVKL